MSGGVFVEICMDNLEFSVLILLHLHKGHNLEYSCRYLK